MYSCTYCTNKFKINSILRIHPLYSLHPSICPPTPSFPPAPYLPPTLLPPSVLPLQSTLPPFARFSPTLTMSPPVFSAINYHVPTTSGQTQAIKSWIKYITDASFWALMSYHNSQCQIILLWSAVIGYGNYDVISLLLHVLLLRLRITKTVSSKVKS